MEGTPKSDKKAKPNLEESIKSLGDAINHAMTFFATVEPDDVPTLLKSFKALKERKEELDGWAEVLSKFFNQLSYETIPSTFERLGYDSIKLSGRNFIVSTRLNASIPQDKKDEGFKWLEAHGLGALIQPSVNSKSLSSAISNYLEQNAELPPNEAITVHQQKYMSVRKA